MKLSKYPLKKIGAMTSDKKRLLMNHSMENIKTSEYTTLQKEDELNLYHIALEEYKDLFPEILLLSKKDFFSSLQRYIQINLATSEKIYPKGVLKKIMNLIEKKYYNEEIVKIEKKLKKINLEENVAQNFVHHCKYPPVGMVHPCGERLFNLEKKYFYCAKCKLIYKSDYILLKCEKCNVNYYTEIQEENNKKENYKPATWLKYHCNALINDTMKCQKCKNILYLNINPKNNTNNTLYCLKCNMQINPYEISWKCVLCNSPFFSEPKIYNKYELKLMLIAIKQALFKGIEAKPKYLPCCKIYGDKVKDYKYLHKKECNGILYEGNLDNKKIVVCSKCHMLNFYENQFWLCPLCKVRFHIQIKNNKNSNTKSENINSNEKYQNMETINNTKEEKKEKKDKKEIYQKKRNNLNLSIEIKRDIFNICKRKDENDIKDIMDKSGIIDLTSRKKKIFSVRNNNQKKMNFNNSYYCYNNKDDNKDDLDNNEHSHIIYSNFKRNENNQRNKQIANSKFILTNYKETKIDNKDDKISIINNLFNRNNNKLINEISRNILSNVKNVNKVNPTQIMTPMNSNISNMNQDSDTKKNNVHFLKNKQPTMYKHIKNKLSYDQSPLLKTTEELTTNNNNINNNEITEDKINKKIMRFNRMISQKEIRENNIYKNNKFYLSQNKKKEKEKEVKILLKENDTLLKEIEKTRKENNKDISYSISEINKNKLFNSDDFNIISQIGQGSFGKIFEVEDKYHRHFALKKIIAYSLKEVEIIKAEYNILYSLQNLEIDLIGIYGIETRKLDRTTYAINVLMELAKCDWEKEIKKRSALKHYYTEKELIIILKKLVKTFSRLQKANVSHRDIKPQNILVCEGNDNLNLKIADFGEAKKIINKNGCDNNTIKQTIRGTELYMSPILFNSLKNKMIYKYTKHNTFKSDVFSLGYCLLLAASLNYKLLCEIREMKSMKEIEKTVECYINKGISFYSDKFWNVIFQMLELDEKNRPDFIELEKIVEDL